MKKLYSFLLLLTLSSLLLVGCGGGTETGGEQDDGIYTVTLDSQGAGEFAAQTVERGGRVERPKSPSKTGYSFDGWYLGDERWSFSSDTVETDITLTARYIPIEYSISYDLGGGSMPDGAPTSFTVENAASITLPTPTRGDLKFDGWAFEGAILGSVSEVGLRDISLTAIFYDTKPEIIEGSDSVLAYAILNENNITVELLCKAEEKETRKLRIEVPENWSVAKATLGGKDKCFKAARVGEKNIVDLTLEGGTLSATLAPVITTDDMRLESGFGITLSDGTVVDANYYPGFLRKAVTFTIDDGRVDTDTEFLSIVKPAGILGTFNLNRVNSESLELYEGYEIANHHKLHSLPFRDPADFYTGKSFDSLVKDELFNSKTADTEYVYKTSTEGLYYINYHYYSESYIGKTAWHAIADDETYKKYVGITEEELEAGYGCEVVGFAYPHGVLTETVKQYLKEAGYLYARRTGNLKDKTGFALPEDRFAWTYNADVGCLLEVMAKYDALADDGTLKFFAFGVHSKDFLERWDVLREFAEKYGYRPGDFYYATNRAIFEYEDAVKALVITDEKIVNSSDIDVYVTVNGVKTVIFANSEYVFSENK